MTNIMAFDKYNIILRRLTKLLLSISGLLCVSLFLAYIFQPDFCAALTFWPAWIWVIPGIALSLFSFGTFKKASIVIIFIWVLFAAFVAEEPLALLRSLSRFNKNCKSSCPNGICLRVISLNCAGGNLAAAEEVSQYAPDIVFLQESPPAKDLEILTKKLFANEGEFILEGDTAILARGRVSKTEISRGNRLFMTAAHVRLPSGLEIETVSVHLFPPANGINLLSPDCWHEHSEDRQLRLQQITSIKEYVNSIEENVPVVVGGDFNAKPWVGEVRILSPRLQDSFKQGGLGWPGTGPANFPLWRVDQIWVGKHFKTIRAHSEANKNSDHRMVICDLCGL